MPSNQESSSTASRVRLLLADVIELVQVRLELFTVEARLETARLVWMLMLGAFAVVLLSFGLIFLSIFITVLLWDTHRELALAVFTALFLGGGFVLLMLARSRFKQGARMFEATRAELQRDKERMQP